jgi:serine/threonine protein kinase
MKSAESPSTNRESVLARLMDDYLASCELGQPLSEDELAGRYPELASDVAACLASLEFIRRAAASASQGNAAHGEGCAQQEQPVGIVHQEQPVGAAHPTHPVFSLQNTDFAQLGDFRIIREVGRGGMGVVYEAEQLSLRRRVALKVLPFAAVLDPKQLQRFKNEALAAAQLDHPHIVDVLGVGQDRGTHFYAMRFIEGCTLADVITEHANSNPPRALGEVSGHGVQEKEPGDQFQVASSKLQMLQPNPTCNRQPETCNLPPPETKSIAGLLTDKNGQRGPEFFRKAAALIADAADALEHAHSLGIVHRDIKPGNLLLDQTGKIWVSDFGLARFADSATLTMTGDLVGTLRYMAPEQALAKHGLVDHRADIYALGCTLYELLTSYPAVLGTDRANILHQIAFDEPLAPRKLNKHIPTELETITLKCLAKSPPERYATAHLVAIDLKHWLSDRPIHARPPAMAQRIAKSIRMHTSLVAATAAFLLLLVAVGGYGYMSDLFARQRTIAEIDSLLMQSKTAAEKEDLQLGSQCLDQAIARLGERRARLADAAQRIDRMAAALETSKADRQVLTQFMGLADEALFGLGKSWGSPNKKAVTALALYGVENDAEWVHRLQKSTLTAAQQESVKETAYELLIALADSDVRWSHQRGNPPEDVRRSERRIKIARSFHEPTRAYWYLKYTLAGNSDQYRDIFLLMEGKAPLDYYLHAHSCRWGGQTRPQYTSIVKRCAQGRITTTRCSSWEIYF